MYHWYTQRNGPHAEVFTNTHAEQKPTQRNHRGTYRRNPDKQHSSITIHTEDIPLLIQGVLMMNYFMVGNTLIKQLQGAPMGSPASPAMCGMVVAVREQCWHNTYQHLIHNFKTHHQLHHRTQFPHNAQFFSTRYVDNRITILPAHLQHLPCFQQLLHPHFYQQPIELEYEPDNKFLGFQVDVQGPQLRYVPPQSQADVMAPQSATTSTVLFSGLRARLHIARAITAPSQQVRTAEAALCRIYMDAGFPPENTHNMCHGQNTKPQSHG